MPLSDSELTALLVGKPNAYRKLREAGERAFMKMVAELKIKKVETASKPRK
jgi:hypothetical protein